MPARLPAKIELLQEDEGTPVRQGGGEQGDIFPRTGSVFHLLSQQRVRNNPRAMQPPFFPNTKLIQIQEIKVQTYLMLGSKATLR